MGGGRKAAVRGKGLIISTGQRATGQGVTFGFGLTPALSRRREREIWCFFPAMSGIRVDETAMGEYSIKK